MGEYRRLAAQNDGQAAAHRALELLKLDELEQDVNRVLKAAHVTVNNGKVIYDPISDSHSPLLDDDPVLRAAVVRLRIADRRAKLLGLDAPTKVEQSGALESVVRVIHLEDTPVAE